MVQTQEQSARRVGCDDMLPLRHLTIALAASGIAAGITSGALAADELSCRQTAGADQSAIYVEQCLLVSSAVESPCDAGKACAAITGEIRQACARIRQAIGDRPVHPAEEGGEPVFCKSYLAN
jgi:hypothetical protein